MKINSSLLLLGAFIPALILPTACSKEQSVAQTTADTKVAVKAAAADMKTAAVDSWDSIKDYSFEKREDFAASLDRMGEAYDDKLAGMKAKVNELPEAQAKAHDAAVKEFHAANAAFQVQLAALRASTAETWAATKTQTGVAWQRVRTSFEALSAPAAS